jgi:glutamate-1-semialdehyde 2,1-aminomutase
LIDRGVFEVSVNLKRNYLSYSHTETHVERTLEAVEAVLKELSRAR